jgi:hypothetical protein
MIWPGVGAAIIIVMIVLFPATLTPDLERIICSPYWEDECFVEVRSQE